MQPSLVSWQLKNTANGKTSLYTLEMFYENGEQSPLEVGIYKELFVFSVLVLQAGKAL